jgi:hypothetical protein
VNAQGWRLINDGSNDYENSNFDSAISKLLRAFRDPSLTYKDSMLGYTYLAASYLQQGDISSGRNYIRIILKRNPEEPIPDVLGEFKDDWDYVMGEAFCNITINSNPQNATVNINDINNKGTTPTVNKLLKDSLYTIEVSMSGYNSKTISQRFYQDSTLNVVLNISTPISTKLQPIHEPKTPINLGPYIPAFGWWIGGVSVGILSYEGSIYLGNKKRENIKLLSLARNKSAQDHAEANISKYENLRTVCHYGSFSICAIGLIAGAINSIKTHNYLKWNSFLEHNDTQIYCAFGENLKPSINIRRNIW